MIHCSILLIAIGKKIKKKKIIMEKISEIWKKWQIVTIGTCGNYSEEGSEKYKKNNKDKNDEETVNDN